MKFVSTVESVSKNSLIHWLWK